MYDLSRLSQTTVVDIDLPDAMTTQCLTPEALEAVITMHMMQALELSSFKVLALEVGLGESAKNDVADDNCYLGYGLVQYTMADSSNLIVTVVNVKAEVTKRNPDSFVCLLALEPVGKGHERYLTHAMHMEIANRTDTLVCHAGWLDYQIAAFKKAAQVLKHPVGTLFSKNAFSYAILTSQDTAELFFNDSECIENTVHPSQIADKFEPVPIKTLEVLHSATYRDAYKVFGRFVFTNENDDSTLVGRIPTDEEIAEMELKLAVGQGRASFPMYGNTIQDRLSTGDWLL